MKVGLIVNSRHMDPLVLDAVLYCNDDFDGPESDSSVEKHPYVHEDKGKGHDWIRVFIPFAFPRRIDGREATRFTYITEKAITLIFNYVRPSYVLIFAHNSPFKICVCGLQ